MRYKLIYVLIFICLPIFSQRTEEASQLFNDKQYAKAGAMYKALLKSNPKNELNNYRYARCCYELGEIEPAIKHFEISGERYPLKNYYLGELYFTVYEFEKSTAAYKKYLSSLNADDERISTIERRIKQAELAGRLLSRVEDIAVIDSMTVDKDDFLNYYRFSSELGTLKQERIKIDSARTEDKITYTTQRRDRMCFSDSIGGKMDIFTSYRLLDDWSTPSSLSEIINSGANENYPFLLLDGTTMYFASEGDNSIGGYDIFITKYIPATNTYLTPENVGMPFNSPFNDYMMLIDEANNVGWFATDRYQPEGKVTLYFFVPNEVKTIFRSENIEDVRLAAQLKTFRKAEIPQNAKNNLKTDVGKNDEKTFEFIITDNLIYTNPDQFKSEDALKTWQELNELTTQLENMKEQLEGLRRDYAKTKTESERSIITPKILTLERNIQDKEDLIIQKNITIRNNEIRFIQGKK